VAVEVSGHTDNFGSPADNKRLSQLRADAVVGFLLRQGAAASSLKAVGYGEEQPVATNATIEGRRLNRRVEFRVSAH
jgi:OOP family OmpA-OmpF porin